MNPIKLIAFLLCYCIQYSPSAIAAKKIKAKGDYTHKFAKVVFPESVDEFKRLEVNSYDKKQDNISASYEYAGSGGKTTVTVFVYTGGSANTLRFRDNYEASLMSIEMAQQRNINPVHKYIWQKKNGYKVNGFQAHLAMDDLTRTAVQLYECGVYLLKLRITSTSLDTAAINTLFTKFTKVFDPIELVKQNPLNGYSTNFTTTSAALRDKTLMGCTFNSSIAKTKWVLEYVDSLERISGYPTLHVDMYAAALDSFVSSSEIHSDWERSTTTIKYIDEIKEIKKAGFTDEFIIDDFNYIMIIPSDREYDFDGYKVWKAKNKPTFTLSGLVLDVIMYNPLR